MLYVVTMVWTMKTYKELSQLASFADRFSYLQLNGAVGEETFGFDRILNQKFYRSAEWRHIRDLVIIRDNGCDLGVADRPIYGGITIHHMNPISAKDLIDRTDLILNPDYLICASHDTHNAIHFGDSKLLKDISFNERKPGDTCPWK